MAPRLQIVASCTDRKALPPAARLRDIPDGEVLDRYLAWRGALANGDGERVAAERLYKGDYWTVVRSLPAVACGMGWDWALWVASAGYGLVPARRRLRSYAATFARGHLDSIASGERAAAASTTWWRSLTSGRKALGGSVAQLAKADPHTTILVLASPAYLEAMAEDLLQAHAALSKRGAIVIVSSAVPRSAPELEACWVPSRASFQARVGGALVSLHARVARLLLSSFAPTSFTRDNMVAMSENLGRVNASTEPRPARAAMSDADVLRFIRGRLTVDPTATHSRLLRALRESGRACEQSRFRRLFSEAGERR